MIDDIKAEIEKKCPKTVSCADILTAAARDATVSAGGPYWMVPYGRKDGLVSVAKEAQLVPMGHEDITSLVEFYQSKGLSVLDLAILSGEPTSPWNHSREDNQSHTQFYNLLTCTVLNGRHFLYCVTCHFMLITRNRTSQQIVKLRSHLAFPASTLDLV